MKIKDKVEWTDVVTGMRKTGVIKEILQVVSQSNEIKNIDDPYEPLAFKDVEMQSYEIVCDQTKKEYSISDDEIEKTQLKVIKVN